MVDLQRSKGGMQAIWTFFADAKHFDSNSLSTFDTLKAEQTLSKSENRNPDNTLSEVKLGTESNGMSYVDNPPKKQWAGLDSNQRKLTLTGLQPVPFSLSGTDPFQLTIFYCLFTIETILSIINGQLSIVNIQYTIINNQ